MKLLASALAVVALAAGCGSQAETADQSKGEVVIALEGWAGYEANAAVLGYLLKNELGYDVRYEELGGESTWEALQAGEIDIIAEDWGKFEARKDDPDNPAEDFATRARYTGIRGQIGWYMPKWMSDKYDGITDPQKMGEFVDVLKTDESKGKIQLLVGDENYISNEADMIEAWNLPVEIVSAGSEENLIEAARQSVADKKPVLFYFWSPHWLFGEMDLVPVTFPKYVDTDTDCTKKYMCGYKETELVTVVSNDFKDNGDAAYQLVKNFNWTATDQSQVAFDITEGGMAPEDAAKKWLDSHADLWQTWVTS